MKVLLISRDGCLPCKKAKAVLKSLKYDVEVLDVTNNTNEENLELVAKYNLPYTMDASNLVRVEKPQIFIEGNYVGGFNDLRKMYP